MRILQINSVIGRGSTGRIVLSIENTILSHNDESFVAYGRQDLSNNSLNSIKIGTKLDYLSHGLSTRLFDNHGLASKRATKKFIKRIKELHIDLIHLHNLHGYYINYKILFNEIKKLNIPVIWTLHDCWPFTGHCSYYTFRNCDKWKTCCNKCPEKRIYPTSWFFDRSKKMYNLKKDIFNGVNNLTIVTPSNWLKGEVEKSFLKYPVRVIHNGIDTSKFYYDEKNIKDFNGKKVILALTSIWLDRKGLDYVYELANRLPSEFVVVIVGLNDKQFAKAPKNVFAIKRTESLDELRGLYSSAYYYINPSLEDNFPTTNLEALCCGTPIIAFNIGGTAEVVNEKTGYVLENPSVEGLVDIILNKEYKFDRNLICNEGRKYNQILSFENYYKLYKEVINK